MSTNTPSNSRFFGRTKSGRTKTNYTQALSRGLTLEPLEDRHLLSSVSFTPDNLVESNTVRVTFGNALDDTDVSERAVQMHIQSVDGTVLSADDITLLNSAHQSVGFLNSQVSDGVTSLLAKVVLGSNYTLTIDNATNDPAYYIQFTVAGDDDGDGLVSSSEYYGYYGEMLRGNGLSDRFISVYENLLGVNLTQSHYNGLYDLDGNGAMSQSDFDLLIKSNYGDNGIQLIQTVSTAPALNSLLVNGEEPIQLPDGSYVTNLDRDLVISGQFADFDGEGATPQGKVTLSDSTETPYTASIPDLRTSGTYVATTAGGAEMQLTYLYNSGDGSFSLQIPDDVVLTDEISIALRYGEDGTENTTTIRIDTAAPSIAVKALTSTAGSETDGVRYVSDAEFPLSVVLEPTTATTYSALVSEVTDPANGVYLQWLDGITFIADPTQLTAENISQSGEGGVSIDTISKTFTLAEGSHTLLVYTTDFVGNVEDAAPQTMDVVVDLTDPTISVTSGYNVNYDSDGDGTKDSMMATTKTVTLTATMADANLNEAACTCRLVNDTQTMEITPTGNDYAMTLAYGKNTVTFTATDLAGRQTTKTLTIFYNEAPSLTADGWDLSENGLLLSVQEGVEPKVNIELTQMFQDEKPLTYTAISNNPEIATVSIDESGRMTLRFVAEPEGSEVSAFIAATATDEYGAFCTLSFVATYSFDQDAPVLTNVTLEGNYAASSLGDFEYITNATNLVLTGTLYDASGVETAYADVYSNGSMKIPALNLLENSSDLTYTYTYDAETQTCTLTLLDAADGTYSLRVYGTDINGSTSTATSGYQEIGPIVRDATAPGASVTMAVQTTGTSDSVVGGGIPKFDLSFGGALNAMDQANGVWVQIFAAGMSTPYAAGKYAGANGSETELTYALETLKDGRYTFRVQLIDAAGNVTAGNTQIVSYDTTAPTVTLSENFQRNYDSNGDGQLDAMYTTESPALELGVTIVDANGGTLVCKLNGETVEESETEGTYVLNLAFGRNELEIAVTDPAGNSGSRSEVIYYNSVPQVVEGANLPDQNFELTGDGQQFELTFAKSDLDALFSDADLADGDVLDYVFSFEAVSDAVAAALISTDVGVVGENYVMSFQVEDGGYDVLKNVIEAGTISVFARDSYREHSAELTCRLLKGNQPVEQLADSISVTQDTTSETPSYVLDLSAVFHDPEGASWYVENGAVITTVSSGESQAKVNGTVTVNEDGTSLTWTPSTGLYGNAVLTLSVTDALGATLDTTLNVQIQWAGVSVDLTELGEAGITLDEGEAFTPTALTDYAVFGNAFDASQAWGGYTVDDTVSISIVEQDVHGYAVDGTNARTAKYSSLFESAPTVNSAGNLVFALNTHAYGTATLRISVEGTANYADLQLTVNDVAGAPYAADYAYSQPISLNGTTSMEYNLLARSNAGSDEGSVVFTGISTESGISGFSLYDEEGNALPIFYDLENPPAEGMAYCVTETSGVPNSWDIVIAYDGECCTFRVALVTDSESALTGVMKVTQLDDDSCTMTDCGVLAGTKIAFAYGIENAGTAQTATGQVELELAISIHHLYVDETDGLVPIRQFNSYAFGYDILNKLRLDDSWVISSVTLNTNESDSTMDVSYNLASESFTIEAGSYGLAVFDYTARDSNGEMHSAQIIMSIQVVNTEPTWADGTAASGKTYSWTVTQNTENPVYTLTDKSTGLALDVRTLFTDYDTPQSELTVVPTDETLYDEGGDVVGILSISESGALTFTPAESSFTTEELDFSLTVTDKALTATDTIASAESAEFGFTLKIVAAQEAPVFADVPGISTTVGETVTINLDDYKAYVLNAGETLEINLLSGSSLTPTGVENQYTFTANEMGVFNFVIEAFNGEKYSDPQTVYIAVGDSIEIVDRSLNIVLDQKLQEVVTSGNPLSETRVLATDLPVDGGTVIKAGSVLKAGTYLQSGTVIPRGATFSAQPNFVGFIDEMWDEDSGTYNDGDAFGLNHDWTLNCDLMLQASNSATRNMTIVNSAILEEGSTLVKGTTFSSETTVYYTETLPEEQITAQMDAIKQIYANAQSKTVSLSDLNSDIQSASMVLGDASSYEVTAISGKTVTIALREGSAANVENLQVELTSGYTLILSVTGADTLDISDYTSGRTIKSVSQSGSTFREVKLEPNSTTAFYVNYGTSTAAYGDVVLRLDNGDTLTVRLPNAPVYPTQDISLNLNGVAIQKAEFVSLPENSCYASVSATSTGIQVAYLPYQVGQDRSDVDVAVTLTDGTQMIVTLKTQYQKPFSYYVTLSDSADKTSAGDLVTELPALTSIANTPETYYVEIWVQCNLPTYQTGLINQYGLYSIIPAFSLTANAEAVSNITAESSVYTQLWSASGLTMTGSALYLTSGTVGSAADGTYARLGLFKVETTGAANLQLALSYTGKAEMSILYNTDKNIGIYAGSDNYISAAQVADFEATKVFPSLASGSSSMWMYETTTEGVSLKTASTSMEVSTEYASGIVDEAAWQATLLDALQQFSVSLNDAVWVDDDAWLNTSEDALPQADEVLNDEAWDADFWAE